MADDNRLVARMDELMRRSHVGQWSTDDFVASLASAQIEIEDLRAAIEEAQRGDGREGLCETCGRPDYEPHDPNNHMQHRFKPAAAVPAEVVAPRFHLETEPWNPPPPYSRDAIPLVESAGPPLPVVGEHEPEIEYQPTCTQCFNAVAYDEEARKWTHV